MLSCFATHGLSNGGIEAINTFIEKPRRAPDGYRNQNYRLLDANGTSTRRLARRPT